MENLVLSLLSGLIGALISVPLTLKIKDWIDRRKAIKYLYAEVGENLHTYDLNQELLKGFGSGKYVGPRNIILPFHHSAWETLKASGYLPHLGKKLQSGLENLYLEIVYENQLILDPTYLTSGVKAQELRDRMSELIPELLKNVEQELGKKLDP